MTASAHVFDPTLLREYDIRGIVGSTLFEADARAIGHAFGTMVVAACRPALVASARDGELSLPS